MRLMPVNSTGLFGYLVCRNDDDDENTLVVCPANDKQFTWLKIKFSQIYNSQYQLPGWRLFYIDEGESK